MSDQALERVVETATELRQLPFNLHRDTVYCFSNSSIYVYDATSSLADDGDISLKPNDVHPLNPGRFIRTAIYAGPGGGGGGAFTENEFNATAAQTVFTLSSSFAPGGLSILFVNGIGYAEGTEYTISGTTLTWLDVPFILDAGDRVVIKFEV
jgi:hypothetical protein